MGLTLRVYAHEIPDPPRSGRPDPRIFRTQLAEWHDAPAIVPNGRSFAGSLAVLALVPGGPFTGEIGLKFFGLNQGANRRFRGWIGRNGVERVFQRTRSGHLSHKNKGF